MLPRALKQKAIREAEARGISLGELIREALAQCVRGRATQTDPLIADCAVYDGPTPDDTAAEHDSVLYGPAKRRR